MGGAGRLGRVAIAAGQSRRNSDAHLVAGGGEALLRFAPVSNRDARGGGRLETRRQENRQRSVAGAAPSGAARSSEAWFQSSLPGGPHPRIFVAGNAAGCRFFETRLRGSRSSRSQSGIASATR